MSVEENKAIVRRYREAHNTNNLDQLDEIVEASLITHTQMPGLPPGLEGGKMAHRMGVASFPDFHTETEELIAEGDKVVERWILTGTHTGAPFLGALASGKKFSLPGVSIYRIVNGQIVEHWGERDFLSLLQQLGLAPALEPA
jgi:C-1 hydroxylase